METETQEMILPDEYAAGLAKEQEEAYDRFLAVTGIEDSPATYHAFIAEWSNAFGWGTDAEHHYG